MHLGQSPFLDIIPDQRIRETLRSMDAAAGRSARRTQSRARCASGSASRRCSKARSRALGSHYVLTLDATDCQTGESLAREQAEATSKERVLAELGDDLVFDAHELGESLPSIQRFDVPIEQATTPSLAALKAYALGLEERRRGRELESVAFFNQAIELDPRVRVGLHHAVDGLRQPRRVAAQRGIRAARQRT